MLRWRSRVRQTDHTPLIAAVATCLKLHYSSCVHSWAPSGGVVQRRGPMGLADGRALKPVSSTVSTMRFVGNATPVPPLRVEQVRLNQYRVAERRKDGTFEEGETLDILMTPERLEALRLINDGLSKIDFEGRNPARIGLTGLGGLGKSHLMLLTL